MLKEFKEFALKGNVLDLAIGVIIGAAFGKIVSSLVADIIMPLIGLLVPNKPNFTALEWNNIKYGSFIQTVFDFLIVAISIFIFVKLLNKAKEKAIKQEEVEETPAEEKIDAKEELLKEIRDLLKK